MMMMIVFVFLPIAMLRSAHRDAMERATDAGHGAECAGRRGLRELDELVDLEAVGIDQSHLARGAQTDGQGVARDRVAAADGVRLVVPGARNRLERNGSQPATGCVVRSKATTSSLRGEVPNPSVPARLMFKLCQLAAPRVPRSTSRSLVMSSV